MNLKAWVAELVGTFGFVFIGLGSVIANTQAEGGVGPVGIALAHGVAIAAIASTFMAVSGGHLNPAVSIAAWLSNKLSLGNLLGYVVGQILGALAAARVLWMILPEDLVGKATYDAPIRGIGADKWGLFALEAILCAFLAWAVIGTAIDKRAHKVGGLFIGLIVFAAALVGGPLNGGSINPARYLGPGIASGDLANWIPLVVGPILGAAVAAILYQMLWAERDSAEST
jgi:MIP family channel proteins